MQAVKETVPKTLRLQRHPNCQGITRKQLSSETKNCYVLPRDTPVVLTLRPVVQSVSLCSYAACKFSNAIMGMFHILQHGGVPRAVGGSTQSGAGGEAAHQPVRPCMVVLRYKIRAYAECISS